MQVALHHSNGRGIVQFNSVELSKDCVRVGTCLKSCNLEASDKLQAMGARVELLQHVKCFKPLVGTGASHVYRSTDPGQRKAVRLMNPMAQNSLVQCD